MLHTMYDVSHPLSEDALHLRRHHVLEQVCFQGLKTAVRQFHVAPGFVCNLENSKQLNFLSQALWAYVVWYLVKANWHPLRKDTIVWNYVVRPNIYNFNILGEMCNCFYNDVMLWKMLWTMLWTMLCYEILYCTCWDTVSAEVNISAVASNSLISSSMAAPWNILLTIIYCFIWLPSYN